VLAPAWPPIEPIARRRFSPWVVGSAIFTIVMMLGALAASFVVRDAPVADRDEYRFIGRDVDGDPVRWNPCEPVHYVVNAAAAPEGSLADVHEAVRRVSQATGIAFAFDGFTDEVLVRRREMVQPERYGERWAPVLVTWVDPDVTDISFRSGDDVAAGVAAPFTPAGSHVIVSGWIAINSDDPNPPGFGAADDQGPVVLHEWAHVMGLDHVKVIGQLMHPAGGGVSDLAPGDLEGLRRVGRAEGCLRAPSPTG
jgi:hypothetical protein